MKKVNISKFTFMLISVIIFGSSLFVVMTQNLKAESQGSETTCYSTLRVAGTGCTYTVTDCGNCKAVTVYEYRDQGTCKTNSWIINPPNPN
jgi:hypothetical protein